MTATLTTALCTMSGALPTVVDEVMRGAVKRRFQPDRQQRWMDRRRGDNHDSDLHFGSASPSRHHPQTSHNRVWMESIRADASDLDQYGRSVDSAAISRFG